MNYLTIALRLPAQHVDGMDQDVISPPITDAEIWEAYSSLSDEKKEIVRMVIRALLQGSGSIP